jgi:hypothetical protein
MSLKAFTIFAETLRTLQLKKDGFYNFLEQNLNKYSKRSDYVMYV